MEPHISVRGGKMKPCGSCHANQGSSAAFVLTLWLWYFGVHFLPAPTAGIIAALFLFILQRKLSLYPLRQRFLLPLLFLLLLPVVPAIARSDLVSLKEILGNVFLALAFAMIMVAKRPTSKLCRNVFLLFVVPLCLWGYMDNYGFQLAPLLESISSFQRTLFRPPGGTHHFLGFFAGLYALESLIYKRKADAIVAIFFVFISWAVSYQIALIAAILFLVLASALHHLMSALRIRMGGSVALVFVGLYVVLPLWFVFFVNSNPLFLSEMGLTRNQPLEATPLSGRDTLWRYNLSQFFRSPLIGSGSGVVRFQSEERGDLYLEDGTKLQAWTESYFDYYLARDGVWGFAYQAAWFYVIWMAISSHRYDLAAVLVFGFYGALSSAFAKISYSDNFMLFIGLIVSLVLSGSLPALGRPGQGRSCGEALN